MKKLLYVFLAITVVFAMVACGNGSTDKPKVEKVTVSTDPAGITTVEQGKTLKFTAKVEGTNSPAQTVTWAVTGGVEGTAIDTAGVLTAAAAEVVGTKLTVTATSTVDKGQKGTLEVTVVEEGAITVDTVTVAPATYSAMQSVGGTQQFTATVTGTGSPAQTVTWALDGTLTGVSISDAGLLTVLPTAAIGTVKVKATSTVDTTKSGEATVTVTEYIEQLFLDNGAYAFYKFDLTGKTWSDFKELTIDLKLEPEYFNRLQEWGVRGARLMGPYPADKYEAALQEDDNGVPAINTGGQVGGVSANANYIIHNYTPGYQALLDLGMEEDTWFTLTYNISGSAAHGSFNQMPAPTDTGVYYFAIGITGQNSTDSGEQYPVNRAILQEVKNVTLVGNDAGDSVKGESTDAFFSYIDPVVYCWRGPAGATPAMPGVACNCGDAACGCINCTFTGPYPAYCQNNCCQAPNIATPATTDYTVNLTGAIDGTAIVASTASAGGIKNAVELTDEDGQWDAAFVIPLTFDPPLDVRSYASFTIVVKTYDATGSVEAGGYQMEFTTSLDDPLGGQTGGYIGSSGAAINVPVNISPATVGLIIKRNSKDAHFVEVTSLVFTAPED